MDHPRGRAISHNAGRAARTLGLGQRCHREHQPTQLRSTAPFTGTRKCTDRTRRERGPRPVHERRSARPCSRRVLSDDAAQ